MTPAAFLLLASTVVSPTWYADALAAGEAVFRETPEPAAAREYARAVSPLELRLPDGRTAEIRDRWLEQAVTRYTAAEAGDRDELAETIADHLAVRAATVDRQSATESMSASSTTAETTSTEDDAEVLETILADQAYQTEQEPPALVRTAVAVRSWIEARWDDVKSFFKQLMEREEQESPFWQSLRGLLTLVAATAAFLVLLIWVIRTLAVSTRPDATDEAPVPDLPEAPPDPQPMAAEAERLAAGGDLRSATRAIYLALLGALHEAGRIEYDRFRTNREYLRDLEGRPEQSGFAEAVDLFDRKWYGHEACTAEELERMQSLFQTLSRKEAA